MRQPSGVVLSTVCPPIRAVITVAAAAAVVVSLVGHGASVDSYMIFLKTHYL